MALLFKKDHPISSTHSLCDEKKMTEQIRCLKRGEGGYKANISKRHVGQIASRISCSPYGTPHVHTALQHTHKHSHWPSQMLDIIQLSHVQAGVGGRAKHRHLFIYFFIALYLHNAHHLFSVQSCQFALSEL